MIIINHINTKKKKKKKKKKKNSQKMNLALNNLTRIDMLYT